MDNDAVEIFRGVQEKGAKCPKVSYSKGKFNHHVVIEDGDIKIMMLKGSKIKAKDGSFEYEMLGDEPVSKPINFKGMSFKGNVFVSTLNKEQKTVDAIKRYAYDRLYREAPDGDFRELVEEHQPSLLIPAGGFGAGSFFLPAGCAGLRQRHGACLRFRKCGCHPPLSGLCPGGRDRLLPQQYGSGSQSHCLCGKSGGNRRGGPCDCKRGSPGGGLCSRTRPGPMRHFPPLPGSGRLLFRHG